MECAAHALSASTVELFTDVAKFKSEVDETLCAQVLAFGFANRLSNGSCLRIRAARLQFRTVLVHQVKVRPEVPFPSSANCFGGAYVRAEGSLP